MAMPEIGEIEKAMFLKAFDDYGDAIFRHCCFRVWDRERARELAQESFTKTWEYLSRGKPIDNIKAFLYRVANNLIIDESRKKKAGSLDGLMEEGFEPEDGRPDPSEWAEAARSLDALQKLPTKYREVLTMRFVEGLGPKEIASILGESENSVSVRINRGVNALKKYLR
jgi:RNA polymerase sigma-70 factor (ECF subfamily)